MCTQTCRQASRAAALWYAQTMSISHRPAHTQLAYRVLFRPSSTQDYLPCLDDLVEEILSGAIASDAKDADGTPLLTLMMGGWDPPTAERNKEFPPHQAPLPGQDLELSENKLGPRWQWPALVGVWKGFDPFEGWPDDNVGWSHTRGHKVTCPALAAIQCHAWTVLEQCLRHPQCPPASRWDALTVANGEPILHRVVNHPQPLKALLAHGLNPDRANEKGQTALFQAQTPEAVKALLLAGANPHHADAAGNNAPTHWGKTLRAPKALLDAWQAFGANAPSNGRMVVSALRSNSWQTVTAAMGASGWDPLSPVDPALSSERLLPAASRILVEQVRAAGTALPIKPLLKLLTIPRFSQAWTAEEKACAAGALWLVKSLNKTGWAFSNNSLSQAISALEALTAEEGVFAKVASVMPSLLTCMPGDPYKEESLWNAWLQSLPLNGCAPTERGWETLGLLVEQPPARLEDLVNEKSGALTKVFERAHASGAFQEAHENRLMGLLRLRSRQTSTSAQLEAADEAWRQAWNALPGQPAFPTDEPWVEKMISKMDKPQARQWKAWALESNFSATAPRKGPRF